MMEKATSSYSVDRKEYHLYLAEIPAYVCTQCKEKLFAEDEVKVIQKLIKHLESGIRELQMV